MITIDQHKIDAPGFPRPQAWWDEFAPVWVDAHVRADDTVELEPSGRHYINGEDGPVRYRKLTGVQARRTEASIARWVGNLPSLAIAIVPGKTTASGNGDLAMSTITGAHWSDYRDWKAGHMTAREAIESSAHREAFMATLARFERKASRHERVTVMWWHAPYIYVEVRDNRWEHPYSMRALISFDLTNGKWASWDSERKYAFARPGWHRLLESIASTRVPMYSDEGRVEVRHPCAHTRAAHLACCGVTPAMISCGERSGATS